MNRVLYRLDRHVNRMHRRHTECPRQLCGVPRASVASRVLVVVLVPDVGAADALGRGRSGQRQNPRVSDFLQRFRPPAECVGRHRVGPADARGRSTSPARRWAVGLVATRRFCPYSGQSLLGLGSVETDFEARQSLRIFRVRIAPNLSRALA